MNFINNFLFSKNFNNNLTKKTLNLFFIVEKIGPYHNARFNYLANQKGFLINVIETNPISETYLWTQELKKNYKVFKLDRSYKNFSFLSKIANEF